MEIRERKRRGLFFGVIIIGIVALLGLQLITRTGIFKVPGVITYDESLKTEELEALKEIFSEKTLDKDLKISARESEEKPTLSSGEYLVEIKVPVTDFYEARQDTGEFQEGEYKMIPLEELDSRQKLLTRGGEYFLDTFRSGATFRIISFKSESFEQEIKPLVDESFRRDYPEQESTLSFAQTGVTALARGMNKQLVDVGGDAKYFAEGLKDYFEKIDLVHTSNEASFSDRATSDNICSDPRFFETLTTIGLDIVELTGNHNQDCGDEAARNSIDLYRENKIEIVGGGKTAEEAREPLAIDRKNNRIKMLAYNLSTGGATLDDTPGANQYDEENAKQEIAKAREAGEFVIVDIQYYECSAYASEYEDRTCDFADSSAGDQVGFFRHLIELGANVVVGTSAHQPQTFELYQGGAIYYGLGNLFFDQAWWPGTTRSLVLKHYFYNGKLLQTRIQPTAYGQNLVTELLDQKDSEQFLERLTEAKPE